MKKFLLEVLTPKGAYFVGEVEELYLKTSLGYMGIMAGHDTLITGVEVAPGFIKHNNKIDYYAIFSGVLHVHKNGVKFLVVEPAKGEYQFNSVIIEFKYLCIGVVFSGSNS